MNVSFCIFRRMDSVETWTLVGAHGHELARSGRAVKIERLFREDLRKLLKETPVSAVRSLTRALETRLEHARLELSLQGEQGRRTLSGRVPLIIETRHAGDISFELVYHPERKQEWFWLGGDADLTTQAGRFFSRAWRELDDDDIKALFSHGREALHSISISGAPKEPKLKSQRRTRSLLSPAREPVLTRIAVDRTQAMEQRSSEELGTTRVPYRAQLSSFVSGAKKRSTLVIGEPGAGRTTLLDQAIFDLLQADDYPSHKNLDLVHHVFQLSGRQLIAGMSYAGDWEQRCFDLFRELVKRGALLWVTDLATFGRTGRSRQSDRSLADVFRGPISRAEIVFLAELTPAELARLEEDAPGFVSLFARVTLPATSEDETFRMLSRETRRLETQSEGMVAPHALIQLLDLSETLLTGRAQPGAAFTLLSRLTHRHGDKTQEIQANDVLASVAEHTGLSKNLLDARVSLDLTDVEAVLEQRVLGQAAAVQSCAELVLRIKSGLTDPRRPYGVFLFTGPTGTGKTELAKTLAAYLYGSDQRLLRFDMAEYSGSDAVSRLIGSSDGGPGLLTRTLEEQPFSVVLFDELEKAHRTVFPLLLQVLDDGRLSDANGRAVSFRTSVVIMTSNLGARVRPAPGFEQGALAGSAEVARAVREFFAPEFVNRIDHVVSFAPLSLAHAQRIVERELSRLCTRPGLRDRNAIVLRDQDAVARIAEQAFRAEDGARSLRRFLEDRVASVLADAIARAPDGVLRLVHLYADESGFHVSEQRLTEAPPLSARFALEGLSERPLRELLELLPEAHARVQRMLESPALPLLSQRIREGLSAHLASRRVGDAELYSLEWLRGELHALHEQLEHFMVSEREQAVHDAEAQSDFVVNPGYTRLDGCGVPSGVDVTEPVRARSLAPQLPNRDEFVRTLARTHFLQRALTQAHTESAHSVIVELTSVIAPVDQRPGLLAWLAVAYARAHGELDCFASHGRDETVSGEVLSELEAAAHTASCVVLRISGPVVRDFFAPEQGMHVLAPSAREMELVHVRVCPDEACSLHERASQLGQELVRGTARTRFTSQLTRLVRFEPDSDGAPSLLELEDYPHAHVATMRVSTLEEALAPLWLMRLSREDLAP